MKTNLISLDRAIRAGGGLLLLATPLLNLHTYPLNLLGIIPLATGMAGYCPLYAMVLRVVRELSGGSTRSSHTASPAHRRGLST